MEHEVDKRNRKASFEVLIHLKHGKNLIKHACAYDSILYYCYIWYIMSCYIGLYKKLTGMVNGIF